MIRSLLRGSVILQRLRVPVGRLPLQKQHQQHVRAMSGLAEHHVDKDDVTQRVLNIIKAFPKVDPSKVTATSHFHNDLGLDSLDAVEIVMAFEQEFALEIPDADADKMLDIPSAIDFIAAHPMTK